jgi:transcriptional regulator of acetoin/glycerol metabolism
VLRDIDTLDQAAADTLRAHLDGAAVGSIAATAGETAPAAAPHEALLDLFDSSATLPALRHRSADLPALVNDLLVGLAPHRNVQLSREAHRLIARHHWPGNLEQLKGALAEALRRRPIGLIEANDLPIFCHSSPRAVLRPVDEVERDAIVAALRDHDGNRVAAAAALGIARSTLYRKIRQYGITA